MITGKAANLRQERGKPDRCLPTAAFAPPAPGNGFHNRSGHGHTNWRSPHVTKTILAVGLMVASSALVAPSALADDNSNPAHVFEKVASYQAMQVSQGMSSAQASGRMAQKSGTAMFDTAYRSDSSR